MRKASARRVGRALRRLRGKGTQSGGAWGDRLLATFGLPRDVGERLRFMGQYHSRFVDLPLPLGADLVQLWDRPPTSESFAGRTWLSLARATLAMRDNDFAAAATHFATAETTAGDDALARAELLLGRATIDARGAPTAEPAALDRVDELLAGLSGGDAECLRARCAGQRGHARYQAGEVERGLAAHEALPDGDGVHPFARSRRANGIAYGRFRLGDRDGALAAARAAATFAGDAGHVRLRAMALLMVARVGGRGAEADEARRRARAIATALADGRLLARCEASERDRARPR